MNDDFAVAVDLIVHLMKPSSNSALNEDIQQ